MADQGSMIDGRLPQRVVLFDSLGNVLSTVTIQGTVQGRYVAAGLGLADGDAGELLLDSEGNLRVNPGALNADSDTVATVGGPHSVGTSTSATTVTHKTGAGVLHSITILGGTAGAITVYDNTAASGTAIFPTFTPGSVSVPVTLGPLDVSFATGLTIITAAATILSVSFR